MFRLKGGRPGYFLCTLPDDIPEAELIAELERAVRRSKKFIAGGKLAMDMGGRSVTFGLIARIVEKFALAADCSIVSWAVRNKESRELLKRGGIRLGAPVPPESNGRDTFREGLLFGGTLRAGEVIEHRGDVIVAGNCERGSEIYASGHIVVLGRLEGFVHAGFGGAPMSVSARSFEAGSVSIGGRNAEFDRNLKFWGRPAVITAEPGGFLIEDWPEL